MIYESKTTRQFKKDIKKAQRQGKDLSRLFYVIDILKNGEKLPDNFLDHRLRGFKYEFRECHIEPDFLLVYEFKNEYLILKLIRLGSHSELFSNNSLHTK